MKSNVRKVKETSPHKASAKRFDTINLLFHGPFNFILRQEQRQIVVVAPRLREHGIWAGTDLTCLNLVPPGHYHLERVDLGGQGSIPRCTEVPLLAKAQCQMDWNCGESTVCLPWPETFVPASVFNMPNVIGGIDAVANAMHRIDWLPTAHILVYKPMDGVPPAIPGLWEGNTQNMHFAIIPDELMMMMMRTGKARLENTLRDPMQDDRSHIERVFSQVIGMLQRIDAWMDLGGVSLPPYQPFGPNNSDGVTGVDPNNDLFGPLSEKNQNEKGRPLSCMAPAMFVTTSI